MLDGNNRRNHLSKPLHNVRWSAWSWEISSDWPHYGDLEILPTLTVGSQTITYASFIDELKTAFRERTLGGRTYKSSAILLGPLNLVPLPSYDQTLLYPYG